MQQLVRLDRVPPSNPLQGLLLLQAAWCDYDVAVMFASRYKFICKILLAIHLFLGWAVVAGSVLRDFLVNVDGERHIDQANGIMHAVFAISMAISFLGSLQAMWNPRARWRHLRSCACSLECSIWLYRTRVGPFELDSGQQESRMPEEALCACINHWRSELISGAGLTETILKRDHPKSVFRHFQFVGEPAEGADDFHSPTQPGRYIELRVKPTIRFYQQRLPLYNLRKNFLNIVVMVIGVAVSVLAHYEQTSWVATSTAAATALMSWSEFCDTSNKIQRYSRSIIALEGVLTWWDSLGNVQQATKEAVGNLVRTVETVISEEQLAWTATARNQRTADTKGDFTKAVAGMEAQARIVRLDKSD